MKNTVIQQVDFRKVKTSNGQETVECEIETVKGFGRASSPLPISSLERSSVPLPRDINDLLKDAKEEIMPELIGMDAENQNYLDRTLVKLDATKDFSHMGGAVSTAISFATAKAAANTMEVPLYHHLGGTLRNSLPYHLTNIIGGGKYTSEKSPEIKEFLFSATDVKNVSEAINISLKAHELAKEKIEEKTGKKSCPRIDEGAWAPEIDDEEALSILKEIKEELSEYDPIIGVDFAAESFWNGESYNGRNIEEQKQYVKKIANEYDLEYVEDPFHWEHAEKFKEVKKETDAITVGDDLYATNKEQIKKNKKAAEGIVIKPDRVGTITGTYEVTDYSKEESLTPILAQRSGETTDTSLSHLAVGFRIPFLKIGAVGGERTSKLNELIRIEETLKTYKMAEKPKW